MYSADEIFAHLVYLALPPTILYPLIYGLTSPWWKTWIGRALLVKAIGVLILISFSALFQYFGPNYWGRDVVRIGGMAIACVGFYLALGSLVQVKIQARRDIRRVGHPLRRSTDR
jgi:hypothetical protein